VKKADIAFINQETLLAGEEFGFTGYPRFNSPVALGRAVSATGFNVINHATNHIMDKGEKAVFATMDFWDSIPEAVILGIHRSKEERRRPKVITKNNITLGFLSYTYGTNGLPVPKDKPYLVSLIDKEIMAIEIDALRPLCDFLVVSMHWGEEYQSNPGRNQKELAAFLAEHKVDLIIGHHPHVIQPVEYIPRPDGGSMLCFYSLGNLISAQTQNPTLLGALAYIKIGKTEGNTEIVIVESGAVPVVTHYEKNFSEFKVYPLYSYTEGSAEKHYKNQAQKEITIDYLGGLAAKILGNSEIKKDPY
jgi:poly-gamma-glutamate synthesis protein (capsule biosynthesis protein)